MRPMMTIKCKRIIDGKTYNTETAALIAEHCLEENNYEESVHLYRTRFGAYFLHAYLVGIDEHEYSKIEPLNTEQARSWLEKYKGDDPDFIEHLFDEMPEAGSGESKFTLRMPDILRERLAARAKANDQSLNAWIIRCLESCAAEPASYAESGDRRDIPPMGNMVRGKDGAWRPRGT